MTCGCCPGTSGSAWQQVDAFYSYWLAFTSCQEFTWADQYNPATAAVRKVTLPFRVSLLQEFKRDQRTQLLWSSQLTLIKFLN